MKKERHTVIPRTGCLIFSGNKILLIKYANSKGPMAGFYNWLGGHIEHGEGIIESANREIYEETKLTVKDTELVGVIHVTDFFGKNVMVYVTKSSHEEVTVTDDQEGSFERVDIEEVRNIDKIFDDVELVIERLKTQPDGSVFSAKARFDGKDSLEEFIFE